MRKPPTAQNPNLGLRLQLERLPLQRITALCRLRDRPAELGHLMPQIPGVPRFGAQDGMGILQSRKYLQCPEPLL